MAILVVYDISDDKTRTRVANKLELMGYKRIQRSVWILPLGGFNEALRTYKKLLKIKLEPQDKIHIFIIPKWSYEKALSIGPEPPKPTLGELKIF